MDKTATPLTNPSCADLPLLGAGAALIAALVAGGAGLPEAAVALCLFILLALLVRRGSTALARFGAANLITLARATAVCGLAGLLLLPSLDGSAWWLIGAGAGLLIAADGIDGWLARRSGTASAFGARFDMETDAALILVLAMLLVRQDRVGAWILASGLLRPGFILAGLALPALQAPLPPRERRRVIAVVQGATLAIAFAPVLGTAQAAMVAGIGLAAAAISFAIDTVWLLRRR